MYRRITVVFMALMMVACSKNDVLDRIEQIKSIGDNNPQEALAMLDSLKLDVRGCSDYVQAKYDLLQIRLNDKAENMPSSDIAIKKLVEYFEDKGSEEEKQEVYYYAGSVYRDLQDTPRALENFFKSLDYAEGNKDCDSTMLGNTYSNITYLQYRVQNYRDAADMAEKELDISKQLGKETVTANMHLCEAYLALEEYKKAKTAMDSAYKYIVSVGNVSQYQYSLFLLLSHYSSLTENTGIDYTKNVKACFSHIKSNPLEHFAVFPCIAFAQYYELTGKPDSAAVYCQRVLDDGTSIFNMHDASKMLYRINDRKGDVVAAKHFADIYIHLTDSMDYGKRQELAATVNNQYKYHLDQKKEQEWKNEKEKYKNLLIIVVLATIILIFGGYTWHIKKRNKYLQYILDMSGKLQCMEDYEKQLNETLKQKEQQLEEKRNQNQQIIAQLHQVELEEKAMDVIENIKMASTGKINMKQTDWVKLYIAVDELYPEFKESLTEDISINEHAKQVLYLTQIGMTKQQITNITGLSRTSIWRLEKKSIRVNHLSLLS